ncbi:MAG: BTAD domain-containing putative transcriptional regulator [Sediminispirochaetaceae bacterium]
MKKSIDLPALYLFGYPRVMHNGQPLHIQRKKAYALLAYLALTRKTAPRKNLAAMFWPDCDGSHARANMRKVLSCIHSALGPGALPATAESIGPLNRDMIWIDVGAFQECSAMETAGRSLDASIRRKRKSQLEEAIALYTADFLSGFTIEACDRFTEWQFLSAEYLKQELCSCLERLTVLCEEEDDIRLAVGSSRRLIEIDMLNEDAHRTLMRLYSKSGQIEAALRQYHICEQVLDRELGIEPDEQTFDLFENIRRTGRPAERAGEEAALRDGLPAAEAGTYPDKSKEIARVLDSISSRETGEPMSSNAINLCLLGDFTLRYSQYQDGNVLQARRYYGRAIRSNPGCSEAYAGLAFSYFSLGGYGVDARINERGKVRIETLARKALSLDTESKLARLVLAGKKMEWDFDFPGAEHMFRELLEDCPDYADALVWFSDLLMHTGRFDGVYTMLQRAYALAPLDIATNYRMAAYHMKTGSYETSIKFAKLADSLYPGRYLLRGLLGQIYLFTGEYKKALKIAEECLAMQWNSVVMYRYVMALACCGRRKEAEEAMQQFLTEYRRRGEEDTFFVALAFHFVGEDEKSLDWLERSCRERDVSLISLAIDPRWGDLYRHHRFQAVLESLGLPPCFDYIEEVLNRTNLPRTFSRCEKKH